jgi:hypothetical protein
MRRAYRKIIILGVLSTMFLPQASPAIAAEPAEKAVSPIFGIAVPGGYRDWTLIAVSHRTDNKDELRAVLGNPAAAKALRKGTLPLPDGAMLAKLAWKREPMPEFPGAFKPGAPPRIEFMVKDSKKYASTGGWGFARFIDGKPAGEADHKTCFPCHEARVKGHDFVFTRFAP